MKRNYWLPVLALSLLALQAGAATIWVDIQDDYFRPYNLYVPAGTTVSWKNYGIHTHTVTDSVAGINSGDLLPGMSFSYTFNTVGDFNYYCIYHAAFGMYGWVHVRTAANLTWLLTTVPTGGPPVIPPGGGTFSYTATLTNLTSVLQPFQYWVKIYLPNMTPYAAFGPLSAALNGGQTKSKLFSQTIPATAPAGSYHYVSYVGTMPDTALAWSSFDFSKSALDQAGGGWETRELSDWTSPSGSAPTEIEGSNAPAPSKLSLGNAPEPFNPTTVITYILPAAGVAQLEVYNVAGEKIAILVNGYREAGRQEVNFDASQLPSGMYIYRLTFGGESIANKMILAK